MRCRPVRFAAALLLACGVVVASVAVAVIGPATAAAAGPTGRDDPGAVVGAVTSASAGRALEGICVEVYQPQGSTPVPGGSACTDAAGHYEIQGLPPGRYQVHLVDESGDYAAQWALDQPTRPTAAAITVPDGGQVRVDAALTPAGAISGTVRDRRSGTPLASATATVYAGRTGEVLGFATADGEGRFRVAGLPATPVSVQVTAGDEDHLAAWYGNGAATQTAPPPATQAAAALVPIAAGRAEELDPVDLVEGGRISGIVTDAATGDGLAGVCVGVGPYDVEAQEFPSPAHSACTDHAGHYVIRGLMTGRYPVQFVPPTGSRHAFQWYPDHGSRADADLVQVTVESASAGINAALVGGGTVRGTAVDAAGDTAGAAGDTAGDTAAAREAGRAANSDFLLSVRDARTGDPVGYATTARDGRWEVTNLPTTRLAIRLRAVGGTPASQPATPPATAPDTVVSARAGATIDGKVAYVRG